MSNINRGSVREEAERIKAEFDSIVASKKIDSEIKILFQSMLMLINLLIAIFLEKTTKKNSKNSSTPPSQTGKDESSTTHIGTNGKGKPEFDAIVNNTRTVETVTIAKVTECDICGQDLRKVHCKDIERRTKIDIMFEKVVLHVDAQIKHCDNCNTLVKGQFPSDMPAPLQYGNGLKAYIINLLICQMIAMKRVQGLIKSMIDMVISEATMLKFILRLYYALESFENAAIEQLLKMPVMHVDETSLRVDKKDQWIHVYCSRDITLKFLHRKRGKEAIAAINIIPQYNGKIIHDCWQSYLSSDNCEHGLCGSHILTELTFIIDSNGYQWAIEMKKLLQDACKKVAKSKKKVLTKIAYIALEKEYSSIIIRGKKEMPAIPDKPDGKRGRIAKSDAHNLWERLQQYKSSVLLFAREPYVAFTNNRAERDLRMVKVKQKVSGCFRSEIYAKAYCRISSYLQTMANKGYNPLIAIQIALAGELQPEEK